MSLLLMDNNYCYLILLKGSHFLFFCLFVFYDVGNNKPPKGLVLEYGGTSDEKQVRKRLN